MIVRDSSRERHMRHFSVSARFFWSQKLTSFTSQGKKNLVLAILDCHALVAIVYRPFLPL